jgi:hypothetical protein
MYVIHFNIDFMRNLTAGSNGDRKAWDCLVHSILLHIFPVLIQGWVGLALELGVLTKFGITSYPNKLIAILTMQWPKVGRH